MDTFINVSLITLGVIFIIALLVAIVYFQGWVLVWLHTAIHPASVFAGGSPWVYGVALAVLQMIFKPTITINKSKD
jgi:hypothetical protein